MVLRCHSVRTSLWELAIRRREHPVALQENQGWNVFPPQPPQPGEGKECAWVVLLLLALLAYAPHDPSPYRNPNPNPKAVLYGPQNWI